MKDIIVIAMILGAIVILFIATYAGDSHCSCEDDPANISQPSNASATLTVVKYDGDRYHQVRVGYDSLAQCESALQLSRAMVAMCSENATPEMPSKRNFRL